MRVNDQVIPGRHLLVKLVLARIPVRRDVGLVRAEDDHHLVPVTQFLPNRVFARYMAIQDALSAFRAVKLERDMVGIERPLLLVTKIPSGWVSMRP
ncbi:hypothetical protein AJ88_06050 [Mesorhizobium amorphae CCBAU 01583]|nr:hypothetical protein AJ88_06050 [Mesorhizobium amorphae CCBAU 01583]